MRRALGLIAALALATGVQAEPAASIAPTIINLAAPGPIGGATASTGAFTTVTSSGQAFLGAAGSANSTTSSALANAYACAYTFAGTYYCLWMGYNVASNTGLIGTIANALGDKPTDVDPNGAGVGIGVAIGTAPTTGKLTINLPIVAGASAALGCAANTVTLATLVVTNGIVTHC